MSLFRRVRILIGGSPPSGLGVPTNALLETTTGAALLETTTGKYLTETS